MSVRELEFKLDTRELFVISLSMNVLWKQRSSRTSSPLSFSSISFNGKMGASVFNVSSSVMVKLDCIVKARDGVTDAKELLECEKHDDSVFDKSRYISLQLCNNELSYTSLEFM